MMKTTIRLMAVMAGSAIAQVAVAQAPAGAPAGATGLCKDGTYWTGATKSGACKGHQGIKDWYAAAPAKAATPAAAAAPRHRLRLLLRRRSQRLLLLRLRQRLHRLRSLRPRRWRRAAARTGLAEYFEQCVPLLWRRKLRHDQGGRVYVGGRREGQGWTAGSWEGLLEVRGVQGPGFRAQGSDARFRGAAVRMVSCRCSF